MSFQGYIDNIKTKTGKSPDDFKKLAEKKGFLHKGQLIGGIKAGLIGYDIIIYYFMHLPFVSEKDEAISASIKYLAVIVRRHNQPE